MEEIARFVLEADDNHLNQAVRDAKACRESRRSPQSCGCFCCDLVAFLKAAGYETYRMAGAPRRRRF